jgi:hypothetical protein
MSGLPSHPDTGPAGQPDSDTGPAIGGWSRLRTGLVIAVVVAAVVVAAVLHLTGVLGGEGH